MNKLEIKVDGQTIKWEEKSHAQIWRNFWNHFIETDLAKTVETIEKAGLRTDDKPEFVAKNGSKKKHVAITEDMWIYSHLTPKAMQKTYEKFTFVWEGGVLEAKAEATKPEDKPEEAVVETQETSPVTPSDEPATDGIKGTSADDELTPAQKRAITRERNKKAKEEKNARNRAEREAKEAAKKAQQTEQLSTEEIENLNV